MGIMFTPVTSLKTKLEMFENENYTQEQIDYLEYLGTQIYKDACTVLVNAVQEKRGRAISICFGNALKEHYNINSSLYTYIGLWNVIKKLSEKDELDFYEIGNGCSVLTY